MAAVIALHLHLPLQSKAAFSRFLIRVEELISVNTIVEQQQRETKAHVAALTAQLRRLGHEPEGAPATAPAPAPVPAGAPKPSPPLNTLGMEYYCIPIIIVILYHFLL